jgi:hypothetical protein
MFWYEALPADIRATKYITHMWLLTFRVPITIYGNDYDGIPLVLASCVCSERLQSRT